MAYIVNLTNGQIVATVADGAIDTTSTSITLLGKGFNNYGELIAEDFVHMMEHFSSPSSPPNPIRGQAWYDSTTDSLNMNTSSTPGAPVWIPVGKAIVSGSDPVIGTFDEGTMWYNTSDGYFNVSVDGTSFTKLRTPKAGTTTPAPTNGDAGDMFYNVSDGELRTLNPNFKQTGLPGWEHNGIKMSNTDPITLDKGDLWYDDHLDVGQVKVFRDTDVNNAVVVGPLFPSGHDSVIEAVPANVDNPTARYIVNGDVIGLMTQQETTISAGAEYVNYSQPLQRGLTIDGAISLAESTNGNVSWEPGTGSPEGVLARNVGSMYTDTDGGAGTTLWVKEGGGSGNTGWASK